MRTWRSLLAVVLLASAPQPAEPAACGGLTPCQCGDTVTESYVVPADLGPCPGHGLLVKSQVTLDCQGRRLTGTGAGSERYGVYVRGDAGAEVRSATVRNCQITGFYHGIRLRAAEDSQILDNRAFANGDFGDHAGYGIDVTVGSRNNLIQGNVIDGNADEGIHLASGTGGNHVIANVFQDNYREQIYLLESHGNRLVANTTSGTGSNSLYLKDSRDNYLEANAFGDRTARVTGDASGNLFVDNVFDRAQLQFHVYDASPDRAPFGNTVLGGAVTNPAGTCLRFVSARDNLVADVALDACGTQVVSEGSSALPSSNTLISVALAPGKTSVDARSSLATGWWLTLRVQDAAGAPVAGARVVVVDALGTALADLTTGADGALPPQPLIEAVRVGNLVTARTPHVVTTTHPDYLPDTQLIEGSQDTPLTVTLAPPGPPGGDGGGGDGGGGSDGGGGGGGGGGGAGTFTDDFGRPDSPSLGNGWIKAQGTDLGIATGSARTGPAKGYSMAVARDLAGADQRVAADFVSPANDARPRFGVVLRYLDERNYYAAYRLVSGSSLVRIVRVVNGVETVLASKSHPKPALNAPFRLGASVTGQVLTLTLDGAPLLSATDAALTAGGVGLVLGSQSSAKVYRADNFAASVD